jgi:hypothetical protein
MALASLVIGPIGLIGCCLPIVGLPLSITGLVLGLKGLKSPNANKAIAGIVFSGLGLMLSVINGLLWVYQLVFNLHRVVH